LTGNKPESRGRREERDETTYFIPGEEIFHPKTTARRKDLCPG